MRPGQVERRTHDYTHHGTTSLFAALNVKTGKVIGEFHHRHRAAEFRGFLDTIEAAVPPSLDVHVILDNYGTPQDAAHPPLARAPSAIPRALHPDGRLVDQPGRTLVRDPHRQAAATRRAPQHARAGDGHRAVH